MDRGADVAEDRVVAARQDRCQPPALAGENRAGDGIDTTVDPTQPAALGPVLRPTRPDPERPQLRERDHPPLPRGQVRQRHIEGYALLTTHVVA